MKAIPCEVKEKNMKGIHKWIDFRGKTGVYLIRNKVNNKRYIGSSLDIATRLSHHFGKLRKSCGNHDLYKDICHYGRKNFDFEILEEVTKNNLLYTEQKWIEKLNPEYNKSHTTGGLLEGKSISEYYKQKLLESHRTDEYRAYMSKIKTIEKGVKVTMINREGQTLKFSSYTHAYNYLVENYNVTGKRCSIISHIKDCCDNKRKKCYGCSFKRVETIM